MGLLINFLLLFGLFRLIFVVVVWAIFWIQRVEETVGGAKFCFDGLKFQINLNCTYYFEKNKKLGGGVLWPPKANEWLRPYFYGWNSLCQLVKESHVYYMQQQLCRKIYFIRPSHKHGKWWVRSSRVRRLGVGKNRSF